MKLLNITDAEKNQKVIEFSVDKATFDAAVDRAYKKNECTINRFGSRREDYSRAVLSIEG